jgi:hypothetical protein
MFINLKLEVLETNYFRVASNIYPQVNSNAEAQKDHLERSLSFSESLRAETIKRSGDFLLILLNQHQLLKKKKRRTAVQRIKSSREAV